MSPSLSLGDPIFNRPVTLREAYRIMERFTRAHYERGETSTGEFLGYLCPIDDRPWDPAALEDFLGAAQDVLGPEWSSQRGT